MKHYAAYTTQNVRCQTCAANIDNHKMIYRILRCHSSTCPSDCGWFAKILTCNAAMLSELYEHGHHARQERSPSPVRKRMKLAHKRFVHEQTRRGVRPARIQTEMVIEYPHEQHLPSLKQIQRVSYHFRCTNLTARATIDEMNVSIGSNRFAAGNDNATTPFTFGCEVDSEGRPNIGNGSEELPMVVGVSSMTLIPRLSRASECTFHMDATFKLNQCGYPVIVIGISDKARSFYPIAMFITSQLTARQYEQAIDSSLEIYERETASTASVTRVISHDAISSAHST